MNLRKGKSLCKTYDAYDVKHKAIPKTTVQSLQNIEHQGLLTPYHKRTGHGVKYARREDIRLNNVLYFRSMYGHLRTYTVSSASLSDMMNRITDPLISC